MTDWRFLLTGHPRPDPDTAVQRIPHDLDGGSYIERIRFNRDAVKAYREPVKFMGCGYGLPGSAAKP